MWLMMAQKTGVRVRNLCDTYGFGSYQTAWGRLQKHRSVMIRTGRDPLTGRVEVDEACVGGQKEGARKRGAEGKTAVLLAVEGDPKKALGWVRFRCVEAFSRKSVELYIGDYVEPGTLVVTYGLSVYDYLLAAGFDHQAHVLTTGGEVARQQLDHVHLFISLLKRWLGAQETPETSFAVSGLFLQVHEQLSSGCRLDVVVSNASPTGTLRAVRVVPGNAGTRIVAAVPTVGWTQPLSPSTNVMWLPIGAPLPGSLGVWFEQNPAPDKHVFLDAMTNVVSRQRLTVPCD